MEVLAKLRWESENRVTMMHRILTTVPSPPPFYKHGFYDDSFSSKYAFAHGLCKGESRSSYTNVDLRDGSVFIGLFPLFLSR